MTKRTWSNLLLTTILGTALSASGCRMCCPSYDYCGPTEPGESNSECCGMNRRGSILGGTPMYVEGATYVEQEVLPENVESSEPLLAPPAPAAPAAPMKHTPAPKLEDRSARRTR